MPVSKTKNKEGKPEFQIVISFCKSEIAQKTYKEGWQIETTFKAMKTSGFNLKDTYLTEIERIKKTICNSNNCILLHVTGGIFLHEHVRPIRALNIKEVKFAM